MLVFIFSFCTGSQIWGPNRNPVSPYVRLHLRPFCKCNISLWSEDRSHDLRLNIFGLVPRFPSRIGPAIIPEFNRVLLAILS